MKMKTTARHFEATPELIDYADERLRKLKRFWDGILKVDVVMSVEKFRHIAEVNVHVGGHDFAAREESNDMRAAIDKAGKSLEKQMKKFKDKVVLEPRKRGGLAAADVREKIIGSASLGRPGGLEVVEEVPHGVHELSAEEAIVLMEEDGRNFLLFNDRESGRLHIVYKRSDGNYGLIEK